MTKVVTTLLELLILGHCLGFCPCDNNGPRGWGGVGESMGMLSFPLVQYYTLMASVTVITLIFCCG